MAPTPTMENQTSGIDDDWERMTKEHPVMRMSRNDKGK